LFCGFFMHRPTFGEGGPAAPAAAAEKKKKKKRESLAATITSNSSQLRPVRILLDCGIQLPQSSF